MTGRGALLAIAALAMVACQSDKAARVDFSETPRDYLAKDEKAHHEIMAAAGFLAKN